MESKELKQNTKSMKVVLCVHIPVATSNGPKMAEVKNLLNSFDDSVVFSGHTHYQRTILNGSELTEQIHAAMGQRSAKHCNAFAVRRN